MNFNSIFIPSDLGSIKYSFSESQRGESEWGFRYKLDDLYIEDENEFYKASLFQLLYKNLLQH